MSFAAPMPEFAVWQHAQAREGYEAVWVEPQASGVRFHGQTTGLENGRPLAVSYEIRVDLLWRTQFAYVSAQGSTGKQAVTLRRHDHDRWLIDETERPELDGCADVDLEASVLTNAFPVHRLALAPGDEAQAPAAYVRAADLAVERLEQHYGRVASHESLERYNYAAPAFDFACVLEYDATGLLRNYPGIAVRLK